MSTNDPFERMVAGYLASGASDSETDRALDDALATTSRLRPYPRWLALMKEPPMRISAPVAVGSPTFRLAAVLALTTAVAAVSVAGVTVGASMLATPPLPDPFGPAKNGSIAYESNGDIYLADADGTNGRAIVEGPALDVGPWFSHDGTRLAYVHDPEGEETLIVANADGTDRRAVVSHPWYMDFSPDDTQMVGARLDEGHKVMSVVDIATGVARNLDLGDIVLTNWSPVIPRPPDGQELIFTGWPTLGSTDKGIYTVRTDGSDQPRLIGALATTESDSESEGARATAGESISFQDLRVSPDGTSVVYWNWEPSDLRGGAYGPTVHQLDLATGAESPVAISSGEPGHGVLPKYSPNGTTVVFEGHTAPRSSEYLFQVPIDGSTVSTPLGAVYSFRDRQGFEFSPDGRTVLFTTRRGATWLVDVESGETTPLDLVVSPESMPSWQRLAP